MTTLLTGERASGREALDDDVDLVRDRLLVTRAQGGDRTAFDDLYMRYYRRLYRFCLRRLHDTHEAEDVAQEAFARAWRALPSFGGDRRFYPWLSVIASHLCTDVLRRRSRSTPVAEFHQSNVASTEDGGEELMLAAVDSDLVAKAFTRLSDRHQRILHLREGSGWSYQRIADHEGVGITAVETLLWRARQALKREFASLAGAEGRMGAWIGAALSAATLRRLLRLPSRVFQRVAATGAKGSVALAGSAVATAAMVIGATVSTPPANPVPSNAGSGAIGNNLRLPATTVLPFGTPSASGSDASTGSGDNGNGAGTGAGGSSGSNGPLSKLPSDINQNPLSGLPSQLNQLGTDTEGTVKGVSTGLTNTVSGLLDTTSNAAQSVLGTASQATQSVLGAAGQVVSGLAGTDSSNASSSSTGSTGTGASGSAANPVSTILNTVHSLLGGG